MKEKLSILWLFATLNYAYCDIVTLMDSGKLKQFLTGSVDGMELTPEFLLGASLLMEIPIAMVLFSRFLGYRANRLANMVAGTLMTVVQVATILSGPFTAYYGFFSLIEIATTLYILLVAWRWRQETELS